MYTLESSVLSSVVVELHFLKGQRLRRILDLIQELCVPLVVTLGRSTRLSRTLFRMLADRTAKAALKWGMAGLPGQLARSILEVFRCAFKQTDCS